MRHRVRRVSAAVVSTAAILSIFLPAAASAQVSLVTSGPSGQSIGTVTSTILVMTPDEKYAVVCTPGNSLDPAKTDTNGAPDVYRRDLTTGVYALVSVNATGNAAGNAACSSSSHVRISTDGRYVAFMSAATNLVNGITDSTNNDVFVRDMQTGTTSLVSVNAAGTAAVGTTGKFEMSDDGRRVAFDSYATTIVPGFVDGNGAGFAQ